MEILNQLGDLFVSAVPTVILVFIFYLFLRWSFFGPLDRILTERHARAQGAQQQAEASRLATHEKTRIYQDALRKARTEIFSEQEAARHRALDERQATVQAARLDSQQNLQAAKQALAQDLEGLRGQLAQSREVLAAEIATAILTPPPPGGEAR